MPDPSWLQSGPGQLDLASPMMQGEQIGQHQEEITDLAKYRQGELADAAAKNSLMRSQLGLESSKFDFERNVWESQADMRTAQLDLVQSQASQQADAAQNVADDHAALGGAMADLDSAAAKGDWNSVLNAMPPDLRTPQAADMFVKHQAQLLATGAGRTAAQVQNASLAATAQQMSDQLDQMKALATVPGVNPNQFWKVDPQTGQKNWDYGGAATAIQSNEIALKGEEAKNSATVISAQTRAQMGMYQADSRANVSRMNNVTTNAERALTAEEARQAKITSSGGQLTPQDNATLQQLQVQYAKAARGQMQPVTDDSDDISSPGAATDGSNSMQMGAPTPAQQNAAKVNNLFQMSLRPAGGP